MAFLPLTARVLWTPSTLWVSYTKSRVYLSWHCWGGKSTSKWVRSRELWFHSCTTCSETSWSR